MDNKNFADSKLNDQELEEVAGGTYPQSMEVAKFLVGYKDIIKDGGVDFDSMRNVLKDLGFESHDIDIILRGKTYTRDEFIRILKEELPRMKPDIDRFALKDCKWTKID